MIAPKISRKMPDGTYTTDEAFAWEAREFLRKKLVGKEVAFRVEYKLPFGLFPFIHCIYLYNSKLNYLFYITNQVVVNESVPL